MRQSVKIALPNEGFKGVKSAGPDSVGFIHALEIDFLELALIDIIKEIAVRNVKANSLILQELQKAGQYHLKRNAFDRNYFPFRDDPSEETNCFFCSICKFRRVLPETLVALERE
jgi:hypothetical protein